MREVRRALLKGQLFDLVPFGPKISKGTEAASATYYLHLHWVRKQSGLLGRWHGSSARAVTLLYPHNGQLCKEVQPMGALWEIWSRRCPHSGWPCGLGRPLPPGQLALAAQPSTYMLHLLLKLSHTCLDVCLGALRHCGSEANLRRGLSGECQPRWDICFSETGLDFRLPLPGCRVGRAAALQGGPSSMFSYTFTTENFHGRS